MHVPLEPCFWHMWAKIYRFWRETRQTSRQFNDHVSRVHLSSDDSWRQKEMVAKFSISAAHEGAPEWWRLSSPPPPPAPLNISSLMTSRSHLSDLYITVKHWRTGSTLTRAKSRSRVLTRSSSPLLLTPTRPWRPSYLSLSDSFTFSMKKTKCAK